MAIPCGDILLEGRLGRSSKEKGVVVVHPHPLYGGTMDNSVVETITRAYARRGYSTLRFNFRGVGASGGSHDGGRGEQSDIRAAVDFLRAAGIRATELAGYSFGTWVLAKLSPLPKGVKRMLMVSPPVAFMDFSGIKPLMRDIRTITGSLDEFAPPRGVEKWLAACGAAGGMAVVQGADHFFSDCRRRLEDAVFQAIDPLPSPLIPSMPQQHTEISHAREDEPETDADI